MRTRIFFLLAAAGLALSVAAGPAGAVSNGVKAPIAASPYVAWVGGRCTGTLIAPDRVLTAGHCLDDFTPARDGLLIGKDGNALIPFGSDPFTAAAAHGGVAIRGFAVMPGFKESFPFAHKSPQNAIALNDVGLILLAQPVTGITPVKLATPADRSAEKVGGTATIFGYGLTGPDVIRGHPKSLQSGSTKVISASACKKAYPHAILPSEICGEDPYNHRAPFVEACDGDSGGPLIRQTAQGPVQIGVTSWGPEVKDAKCGAKHLPGVYMRVSSFASFVTDPNPVIEPFQLGDEGFPKVTGVPKVGETLTCNPPHLGGSPATLHYKWVFHNKVVSTKQTVQALRVMAGHSVGCSVVARNAGGHFDVFSPRVGRLTVQK
jgi:Trypsin